jgi:xanthine phosphoribosyltransferase
MDRTNRRFITWEQINDACNRLAVLIKDGDLPSGIVPVPRGGYVPSVILSYALDVPIVQNDVGRSNRSDLLVVDDICDTGATFTRLRAYYPEARFAALFIKPAGKLQCNYAIHPYFIPVPQDVWITFPWSPLDYLER